MERDREVNEELKRQGWTVLRYWENDIFRKADEIAEEIAETVRAAKSEKEK